MYIRSLLAIVSALLITASIAHSEMWPVHPEENGGERYEVCSVDLVNGACPGQMVTVYRNAVGSPQGLESDFGPRRQESPMHQGIDYAVSGGTPVYAVRGGTVTFKDPMAGSSGYTIIIQDAQGMYHAYRHLTQDDQAGSVYSPLVERFQTVLEGQQIGWSGNTGTGTYHLHYDYYQETAAGEQLFTNPLSILPYNNQRSPIVEIEQPTPDGTTVLGTGANRIQEVIARVRSAEKDVSRVNITISPGNIERDFNFEREGRNQVSVQQNANGAGAVNSDHFVRPGAMTQGTGESNDAFIYRWNLSQYLASLGQISADNVTIRVKAWDAQGLFSTTERTVSVGNNAPTQRAELQPAGPAVKEAPTAMASIEPVDGKSPFTPQEMVWHAELAVASEIQLFKPTLSFSAGNTKASYNQKITGLEDGPHSATFKLVDKEGQVLEQKQELFFLDTTPPTLELVSPLGSEIPPSVTMFVVRFDDQGSGIPSIPKEMKLSALVNNQNATSNTAEKSGQRFLILDAKKVPWSPGQAVTLDVTIEDRAGNTAELHKTYTVEQPVEAITGKTAVLTLPIIRPAKTVVFTAGGGAQGLSTPASRDVTIQTGTLLGYKPTEAILQAFSLESLNPLVEVVGRTINPDTSTIVFQVRQNKPVKPSESLQKLELHFPDTVKLKFSSSLEGGGTFPFLLSMAVDQMTSQDIPVSMIWSNSFRDEITLEGDTLIYRTTWDNETKGVSEAISWFELEGEKSRMQGSSPTTYEARIKTTEGYHFYRVNLTVNQGMLQPGEGYRLYDNNTRLEKEGMIQVKMDAPLIEEFSYDGVEQRFQAKISDKGTPFDKLDIQLDVSGAGLLSVERDSETGMVWADFPVPKGIVPVTLEVTDLGGSTSRAKGTVFGTPSAGQTTGQGGDYDPTYKVTLGVLETGDPKFGSINGKQWVTECQTIPGVGTNPMESQAILDCVLRMRAKNPRVLENSIYIAQCMASLGITGGVAPERVCTVTLKDTLAPRIRDVRFHPTTRAVTAKIDDYGMPLDELQVGFYATDPPFGNGLMSRPHHDYAKSFAFGTGSGEFSGYLQAPSEVERFDIVIPVRDRAGNAAGVSLEATVPNSPPRVSLQVVGTGELSFDSAGLPWVTLVGLCYDVSDLNHDLTITEVDGEHVQPAIVPGTFRGVEDLVFFETPVDEGDHSARIQVTDYAGLTSQAELNFPVKFTPIISQFKRIPGVMQRAGGPAFTAFVWDQGGDLNPSGIQFSLDGQEVDPTRLFFDSASGYLSVDGPFEFAAGQHKAEIKVTDSHGHTAQAELPFQAGEALTVESGGTGLKIADLTLFELEHHNNDGEANPGELVRIFISLKNDSPLSLDQVTGKLISEDVLALVERSDVAYGSMAGNQVLSPVKGFDVRISRDVFENTTVDPRILSFRLEVQSASGSFLLPVKIPVRRPSLPVPGAVTIEFDRLPSRTNLARIEVKGKAASTVADIEAVTLEVNGREFETHWHKSDSRFSATVDLEAGGNILEARARDATGGEAAKTAFITRTNPFTPPSVTISFPEAGGSYIGCGGTLFLTGSFSTGGAGLASITARYTDSAGVDANVPLVVTGTNYTSSIALDDLIGDNVVTSRVVVTVTTTEGASSQAQVVFDITCPI